MNHSVEQRASSEFAAVSQAVTRKPPVRIERPPKPAPFSLRLSKQERDRLEQEAGHMTVGAYIRDRLFGDTLPKRRPRRRPVKDQQALAQVLGQLGNAHLANNLNQLAKAANSGTLSVTGETEEALRKACDEVHAMRQMLMQAVGLLS